MKLGKKILGTASAIAVLAAGSALAQEADDFGAFDEGGFGDFAEESGEPALTFNGEAGASGRAWIRNERKGGESGYQKPYDISHSPTEANAYLKLDLNYSANSSDLNGKLKFDASTIQDHPEDILEEFTARGYFGNWQVEAGKIKNVWGKGDKLHVLDNFNANDYTDFVFPDYIDRRLAEPMAKISYASTYSGDYLSNIKLEGIWTPMMTADRFAEDGELVPYTMSNLTNTVTGILKHNYSLGLKNALSSSDYDSMLDGIMELSGFSQDDLYEDNIKTLKYGQAGARLTGTLAGVDLGFSYYYGHYKQPSANLGAYIDSVTAGITNAIPEALTTYAKTDDGQTYITTNYGAEIQTTATALAGKLMGQTVEYNGSNVTVDESNVTEIAKAAATKEVLTKHSKEIYAAGVLDKYITVTDEYDLPSLNYDQLQVFGLEAAFVLWKFNTRWEFAYNLTEDIAGDNPWVRNNSIAWVGGFDMDLPIHNLNINIQEQGKYVLHKDKIEDEDSPYYGHDVDFNSDGKYTQNQLVVNISDKWLNEKLTTECTTIYVFETKEWCVTPKISYNVVDGLTFILSGGYIYSDNENGQFYNFTASDQENHNKAFVQLGAKYQF